MRGVWTLLGKFREGDRRLKDKDLMTAWWLTFQPYEAEDLREAIAAHFRRKSFFPDIAEIVALMPTLPCSAAGRTYDPMGATAPQPISRREAEEQIRLDRAYMLLLLDQCREEG